MLRTRSGLPKHCCWNLDRHGKRRVRFRKAGFSVYLTGIPWSEEFMRAYATALEGVQVAANNAGTGRIIPGSMDALIVKYYRSPEFLGLKASTQAGRRGVIEAFRSEHGTKPVARLTRAHVKDIIGARSSTPAAANNLLKALRVLLRYAVEDGMIDNNPAVGVKRYRSRGEGIHTWTEDEIAQFQARHPLDTRPGLALALLLHTTQRRSDVIRLGWQHVKGDVISLRQEKTDEPLQLPMHPELVRALRMAPRTDLTFLVAASGRPFTGAGFGFWFKQQCKLAGLPHCSAHGLRKAGATRLANAGCSTDQIKAMTGHKSLSEVARYTKAADQRRLAQQALSIQLGREQNASETLSNLEPSFVQPGSKPL
jgi:integrase